MVGEKGSCSGTCKEVPVPARSFWNHQNQSVNQSISQSINQSISQSVPDLKNCNKCVGRREPTQQASQQARYSGEEGKEEPVRRVVWCGVVVRE